VKWRLVIRAQAETDLREAHGWYERQRAGLGAEFITEIEAALESLVCDPQRHTVYYRRFRRAFMHRFPYSYLQIGRRPGDRIPDYPCSPGSSSSSST